MRKIFFGLFLFSINICVAQDEDSVFIRKLADEVLTNSGAYENLRVLTKQIGGRLAGSPQMVQAERWGLKAMQAAGADASWLQQCMVPHWVRGGADQASALQRNGKARKLDVVALGNSIGSKTALKAPVIEVLSFDDLEAKKDSIKNRIVFYNYKFNPRYVRTFQAYGEASVYRGQGPSRAAKYGAAGVIVRAWCTSK